MNSIAAAVLSFGGSTAAFAGCSKVRIEANVSFGLMIFYYL